MAEKVEYDFLDWVSFPSSIKKSTLQTGRHFVPQIFSVWCPAKPGDKVRVDSRIKTENVPSVEEPAGTRVTFCDVNKKDFSFRYATAVYGDTPWILSSGEWVAPETTAWLWVVARAGGSDGVIPAVSKFDDLKIWINDMLFYSNDFSNWNPVIGVGVGVPIGGVAGYLLNEPLGPMVSEVVGAGLGGGLGAVVGLLTAAGVIPIPAFGAAPEGPGAPARLGKYLITG